MVGFQNCVYTYRHREAFSFLIEDFYKNGKLTEEQYFGLQFRAEMHDVDKLLLYQIMSKEEAHILHRTTQRHHIGNKIPCFKASEFDILETIFDCECAGLTKPDKPRNAFKTFIDLYPDFLEIALPYLKKLGMDREYNIRDNYSPKIISSLENMEVTEKDILNAITRYSLLNNANINLDNMKIYR